MEKEKKKSWIKYVAFALCVLIGMVCGFIIITHLDSTASGDRSNYYVIFIVVFTFVGVCVAFFLQILVHEAGHLVFGLLTGYRFLSFRVGSFMLIKEGGRLKIKRLSIAGTGGQCLLIPPDVPYEMMPSVLYNLGGSFANIAFSIIVLVLFLVFKNVMYLSALLRLISVSGFVIALLNGIPMKLGLVSNDGYNARAFAKDSESLRSFCVQMRAAVQTANGVRLKDMPEEWFFVPPPEQMKNSTSAALGAFACNRLLDSHLFEEADRLIDEILDLEALAGLHRKMLICDKIFLELIGDNREDILDGMRDKPQKQFMKSMRKFPTVLRTEYAYALLSEKQPETAGKILAEFEKVARTYPYDSDVESERELICVANRAAAK